MSGRQRPLRDQTDLFVTVRTAPAGFVYQDDLISAADESVLLDRFQDLPFKPSEFALSSATGVSRPARLARTQMQKCSDEVSPRLTGSWRRGDPLQRFDRIDLTRCGVRPPPAAGSRHWREPSLRFCQDWRQRNEF